MNQRQHRGPGSSGSNDIETGKAQDPRDTRHPGESNLAENPQQMQQNPQGKSGQHGGSQGSSGQKGQSQQQEKGSHQNKGDQFSGSKPGYQQGDNRQGAQNDNQQHKQQGQGQQHKQEGQGRQGVEQGRNAGQANVQSGQAGNQGQGHKGGSGQHSQQNPSSGNKQYGEGNYAASKDYNERTKQFVESGKVDQAAKDAAPRNEQESREMKDAEREGRRPMREEDPALNPDKSSKKPGHGPDTRQ